MTDRQYDDAILDSNAIDPTDVDGNPIPVTIPIKIGRASCRERVSSPV